jgi:hypothetical protein
MGLKESPQKWLEKQLAEHDEDDFSDAMDLSPPKHHDLEHKKKKSSKGKSKKKEIKKAKKSAAKEDEDDDDSWSSSSEASIMSDLTDHEQPQTNIGIHAQPSKASAVTNNSKLPSVSSKGHKGVAMHVNKAVIQVSSQASQQASVPLTLPSNKSPSGKSKVSIGNASVYSKDDQASAYSQGTSAISSESGKPQLTPRERQLLREKQIQVQVKAKLQREEEEAAALAAAELEAVIAMKKKKKKAFKKLPPIPIAPYQPLSV